MKFHSVGLYSKDFQQLSVAIVTVRALRRIEILNCMRNVCILPSLCHTHYVFKTIMIGVSETLVSEVFKEMMRRRKRRYIVSGTVM